MVKCSEKGRVGRRQTEAQSIGSKLVDCLKGLQECPLRGEVLGLQNRLIGKFDIRGCKRLAIVECDVPAQIKYICLGIHPLPVLSQLQLQPRVLIGAQQ